MNTLKINEQLIEASSFCSYILTRIFLLPRAKKRYLTQTANVSIVHVKQSPNKKKKCVRRC